MKRTWFARIAAFALALGAGAGAGIAASSLKVTEAGAAVDGSIFRKITSVSDLEDGDEIIFVSKTYTKDAADHVYAMSKTQNSNNRGYTEVSFDESDAIVYDSDSDIQVITVKTVGEAFAFHTGTGYLNAPSSSNNYLRTSTTAITTAASGNQLWTLAADENGVFSVTNTTTKKNVDNTDVYYFMAFNTSNSLFSAYASSSYQAHRPYIYRKDRVSFGPLASISVATDSSHKTAFDVGDEFNADGLKLIASDGTNTIDVAEGFTTDFDGKTFIESDAGAHEVTVSYTRGEITKTTTYKINVFGAPVYAASMADDFDWDDFENGTYYAEKSFAGKAAVSGVTPEWLASSVEVFNSNYIIGDYVNDGDADKDTKKSWANFAGLDSFAGIAKGLTDNSLSGNRTYAMLGKNFTIQGLSRVTLHSTKASVAGFSAYVLGSKDGGYTWSLLGKTEGIPNGAEFSVDWAGDDYSDGSDVAVAFVFATSSAAQRPGINNVSFKLYGTKINSFSAWEAVSLSLGGEDNSVEVGSTLTLPVTCSPAFAASAYSWSSSNTNVATVANGVVTGVAAGSATITVSTAKGAKAEFDVTVVNNIVHVTGVTLDKTSANVTEQSQLTLTATVAPENASNKNVNWSSSDETVATVADGVVTAIKAGTTTITVTTVDGEKTATCEVTVDPFEGKYVLVDDLDMLYNGAEIIFGNETARVVAKYVAPEGENPEPKILNTANGKFGNKTVDSEDATIFVVEKAGDQYRLKFKSDSRYLSCGKVKELAFLETADETSLWDITIEAGILTMSRTLADESTFAMKYNSGSPRFTTYASGQQNLEIYAIPGVPPIPEQSSEESSSVPEQSSEESSLIPEESSETPSESSEAPAESSEVPAESSEVPAETSEAPEESSVAPSGYSEDALRFGERFLLNVVCDGGVTAPNVGRWNGLAELFAELAEGDKEAFMDARANENGNAVEAAVARYDFIIRKYGTKSAENPNGYVDFMSRFADTVPAGIVNHSSASNSHRRTMAIVTCTVFGAALLGAGLIAFSLKRKHKEDK